MSRQPSTGIDRLVVAHRMDLPACPIGARVGLKPSLECMGAACARGSERDAESRHNTVTSARIVLSLDTLSSHPNHARGPDVMAPSTKHITGRGSPPTPTSPIPQRLPGPMARVGTHP